MRLLFSYASRLWRRKSTLLGLLLGVLIFLICAHYTASPSSGRNGPTTSRIAGGAASSSWDPIDARPLRGPAAVQNVVMAGSGKRLQNYNERENEVVDEAVPYSAGKVVDGRGVKFIRTGDGSPKGRAKLPSAKPHIADSEIEYYKQKNRALYQARAKIAKAKASKHSFRHESGGNLQPAADDNVEYNQEKVVNGELLGGGAPIYRENFNHNGNGQQSVGADRPLFIPQRRLVHLDLKGAPPKVNYLLKVLKLSAGLGATGVLLEYEDMFPFTGKLVPVAATNHYTAAEVDTILAECKKLGLDVIPLVQTFGHMEFALKLPQFSHLRDVAEMPESICPCDPDALLLIKAIVDQVAEKHPDSEFLHIGCDEVFHLGECSHCQGRTRTEIFVSHVVAVANYVRERHHKVPIVWDDMLRNLMPDELSPLAQAQVEPMVWWYGEDVYRFIPTYTWDRFEEQFNTSWGASAFKGAHGPTLAVPPVKRHLDNNLNWLDVMSNEDSKFGGGVRGIVITGWQRYDHFGVLAELLPSALPSLAVDLVAVRDGYFNSSNQPDVFKGLECVGNIGGGPSEPFDYDEDPYLFDRMSWCYFPGASVFKMIKTLIATRKEVDDFLKKARRDKAWLTDYSVARNYSSPFRIEEIMEDWAMVHSGVVNLARTAREALAEVYDEYTVAEYVEQKILPMYKELAAIKAEADALKKRRTWQVRPLPVSPDLAVLGIVPGQVNVVGKRKSHYSNGVVRKSSISELSPRQQQQQHPVYVPRQQLSLQQQQQQQQQQLPEVSADSWKQLTEGGGHDSVIEVTGRPKRLVQAQDNYRHPPGYRK